MHSIVITELNHFPSLISLSAQLVTIAFFPATVHKQRMESCGAQEEKNQIQFSLRAHTHTHQHKTLLIMCQHRRQIVGRWGAVRDVRECIAPTSCPRAELPTMSVNSSRI